MSVFWAVVAGACIFTLAYARRNPGAHPLTLVWPMLVGAAVAVPFWVVGALLSVISATSALGDPMSALAGAAAAGCLVVWIVVAVAAFFIGVAGFSLQAEPAPVETEAQRHRRKASRDLGTAEEMRGNQVETEIPAFGRFYGFVAELTEASARASEARAIYAEATGPQDPEAADFVRTLAAGSLRHLAGRLRADADRVRPRRVLGGYFASAFAGEADLCERRAATLDTLVEASWNARLAAADGGDSPPPR